MKKTFVSTLIVSIVVIWSTGCQKEESTGVQNHRQLVLENKELKAQLKEEAEGVKHIKEQCLAESKKLEDEIKRLEKQYDSEIKKKDDEIKQCTEQLSQCAQIKSTEMQKEADKQVWDMVTKLGQANDELSAEVERLKAELAKVNGQK